MAKPSADTSYNMGSIVNPSTDTSSNMGSVDLAGRSGPRCQEGRGGDRRFATKGLGGGNPGARRGQGPGQAFWFGCHASERPNTMANPSTDTSSNMGSIVNPSTDTSSNMGSVDLAG